MPAYHVLQVAQAPNLAVLAPHAQQRVLSGALAFPSLTKLTKYYFDIIIVEVFELFRIGFAFE